MLERRYRVKDLVNYPERQAKDYLDRRVAIVDYLTNLQLRDC